MTLADGCDRRWRDPDAEGQCLRCRRCLACCARTSVHYSCAARDSERTPERRAASARAYERWTANPTMLGPNRRIT